LQRGKESDGLHSLGEIDQQLAPFPVLDSTTFPAAVVRGNSLGQLQKPSEWRLPLFKSAKLKQNVARCCGQWTCNSTISADFCAVWFLWADKPSGRGSSHHA